MLKHTSLIIFILFNISYFFKNYNEISEKVINMMSLSESQFSFISYNNFEPSIILPISNSSVEADKNINIENGCYEITNSKEKYLVY